MTPVLNNRMAVIMGKKMPRNTGMALEFELTHFKILPSECDAISKPAANDSIANIPITPSTSLDSHHHRVKSTKRRVHFDDTPLIGRVLATLTVSNDELNQTCV
jgi:hypothetical protein